jgi:hypothetical protein
MIFITKWELAVEILQTPQERLNCTEHIQNHKQKLDQIAALAYKRSDVEQGRIIGWKESAAGMYAEASLDTPVPRRLHLLCSENMR